MAQVLILYAGSLNTYEAQIDQLTVLSSSESYVYVYSVDQLTVRTRRS